MLSYDIHLHSVILNRFVSSCRAPFMPHSVTSGCSALRRGASSVPQGRPGGSSSVSSSRAVSRSSSMRNDANREAREAKETRDAAVNLMQQVRIWIWHSKCGSRSYAARADPDLM